MAENTLFGGVVEWSEEDQCFVGSYPGIIGPCCHADDEEEVYRKLRRIVEEWLEIEYEDQKGSSFSRATHFGSYVDRVKSHLSEYRRSQLGVEQVGTWRGRSYDHILPRELLWLNLIETFRAEARKSLEDTGIRLNQYFHHLNSSQAACLNLFWPLLNSDHPNLVVESLGIGPGEVEYWEFEKVVDQIERTNFDLYLELNTGTKTFIEFKYTEEKFGKAKDDEQHRKKLRDFYVPALRDSVLPEFLEREKFFANYQLLRHLVYVNAESKNKVVFVIPRGNEKIVDYVQAVLESAILDASVRSSIAIRYIEDFVSNALARLSRDEFLLRTHLHLFREKYVV